MTAAMQRSERTTSAPARRSGGRYILHEELGRGAMAIVHRATSPSGRIVALKQLKPYNEFDVDFDLVRSFVDEARLATRFCHPNIARTYALGKIGRTYCIETEFVRGHSLVALSEQCRAAGAMPIAVVVELLVQICDALDHVHTLCDDAGAPLSLVHRDVSLSNIIVSDAGVAKLIDFGIVKGHSSQAPTEAGLIKGKLGYVAPEYLAGRIDSRADLFALGVIAHELLTDQRLFYGANDLETITRLRTLRVPPPSRSRPEVSHALDAIVMRALQREPDQRWQSAREMRDALVAARELATPRGVAEWTAWAFAQKPRTIDPQLAAVLDSF
jgi:eukaryotic-like serine/threonine-protein kinase